jgi:hypothetical protein
MLLSDTLKNNLILAEVEISGTIELSLIEAATMTVF